MAHCAVCTLGDLGATIFFQLGRRCMWHKVAPNPAFRRSFSRSSSDGATGQDRRCDNRIVRRRAPHPPRPRTSFRPERATKRAGLPLRPEPRRHLSKLLGWEFPTGVRLAGTSDRELYAIIPLIHLRLDSASAVSQTNLPSPK